ncbi:DcrB-related protein [Pseudomonas protegens]|uniref:DcrB-related protein n=1 Tax=Pseudomonas protegens TaxID=380021 RepID=UPI002937263C|nr:DcrB-related protein [Pseudomonas protegens]WOE79520.1 DcrB-related protein [Pseudomonas protegens]
MTYRINEFQFALPPSELLDASINILKFPELGTSLIVSRSQLAAGETLQSNFDSQLKKLEQQVQELRYQPGVAIRVGSAQEVDALELRSQFNKGTEQVFQYQLALVLPGTRKMLALSYVKAQPLNDSDAAHWASIKQSLNFNTP